MAQKSCLYLYHCLQGQMHYLILNSKICDVAHSAHSKQPIANLSLMPWSRHEP